MHDGAHRRVAAIVMGAGACPDPRLGHLNAPDRQDEDRSALRGGRFLSLGTVGLPGTANDVASCSGNALREAQAVHDLAGIAPHGRRMAQATMRW